jgi:hypothetical protein
LVDLSNGSAGVQRVQSVSNKYMLQQLYLIGIDENDIAKLNQKTPTRLARQLIRLKYPKPDPDQGFLQADKTIVEAIISTILIFFKFIIIYCIDYVQYCYPHTKTSDTDIRRAMNNYFSSFTYQTNHSHGH